MFFKRSNGFLVAESRTKIGTLHGIFAGIQFSLLFKISVMGCLGGTQRTAGITCCRLNVNVFK